jgi:serine/threonine protein kinase
MSVVDMTVAGRYRLDSPLGAGGMGRVWLARDEVLHRDVAIKEVTLPFGLGDEERERLRLRTMREARAAARLSHPNVVQIYDVVRSEDQPWIVMEYVRARSLHQVVNEDGPLGIRTVAAIGFAMLSALDAAHRSNVLHRDVKPSNVLIAEDGRVVLTDFGLATIDEGEGAITQTGLILGSPEYIAPERAHSGISTPESDLWSLGATLYAAVEGRSPHARATALGTLIALGTERPDPMRRAGELKRVLAGLLRRDPKSRMTAAEARWRLGKVAVGQSTGVLSRPPKSHPLTGYPTIDGDSPLRHDEISPLLGVLGRAAARRARPAGSADAETASDARTAAEKTPARAAGHAAVVSSAPTAVATARVPSLRAARSVRWRWAAVAAAALIALVSLALRFDVFDRQTNTAVKGPGGVPATAQALPGHGSLTDPSTSLPASRAPDPNALPAGWNWYRHETGFRTPVPAGWTTVEANGTATLFCAPGGPPLLKVGLWNAADAVPATALQREEEAAQLPGYRRVRLEPSTQGFGAEWEYSFQDPKMGPLHGMDHGFVVAGQRYLIQWRTAPGDWQANLASLQFITSKFRPIPRPGMVPD